MTCRWSALALAFLGCASPVGTMQSNDLSAIAVADLATPGRDGSTMTPRDLAMGDGPVGPCVLGTPDHCGTCATVCPPGMDDDGNKRTCSGPTAFDTCGVICKGEYYDVNGMLSDGCEALDEPLQDTSTAAVVVSLPNVATAKNIVDKVYGDAREHDVDPLMRPNGREDWYRLDVVGQGSTGAGVTACLGITNFPGDNMFEVCLSVKGQATFLQANCKTATGMTTDMASTSQCIAFADSASEGGAYYVRIRKLAGSQTPLQYALNVKH